MAPLATPTKPAEPQANPLAEGGEAAPAAAPAPSLPQGARPLLQQLSTQLAQMAASQPVAAFGSAEEVRAHWCRCGVLYMRKSTVARTWSPCAAPVRLQAFLSGLACGLRLAGPGAKPRAAARWVRMAAALAVVCLLAVAAVVLASHAGSAADMQQRFS